MLHVTSTTRVLLSSFAMLAMVTAQSSSVLTAIDSASTSAFDTSYTLTGTSIASATGSPSPVRSTAILVGPSIVSTSNPTSNPSNSSSTSSSNTLTVPALAGIAAGGAFLLITIIVLTTYLCIRRRRKENEDWPELPPPKPSFHQIARPVSYRRPSSAITLVDAPAQAYVHSSKASLEFTPSPGLKHSKSAKSCKSTRSTVLERVSEEGVAGFKFDFEPLPTVVLSRSSSVDTHVEPAEKEDDADLTATANPLNGSTLQLLSLDKSLPNSPEHENTNPMNMLDVQMFQGRGRPTSSIYSSPAAKEQGRSAVAPERQSLSYL